MKTRISTLIAAVLVASSAFAENIISLELRAPAPWAGESLGPSGGSWAPAYTSALSSLWTGVPH